MDSDAPPAAAPRPRVAAVLAATTAAQIASVMGAAVFPVIAPRLAAELGVDPALIGYQMSMVYGAAALAAPLLGTMAERRGACRTIQIGLGLCAAGLALGLAASPWALAATSVLLGFAMSVITPASAHLLYRHSPPRRRNLIFSLKQTGVPLGWGLVALCAPAITLALGWRWALAAVLAVALATLLALQPARAAWDDDRRPRAAAGAPRFAGLALLWQHPVLRAMALASLCLSFVQLCLVTFAVTMLVTEIGYSLVAAGVMLSLVQAAGVAGRVFWGWAGDRTGDSLGLLCALGLLVIACCAATAFVTPAWPAPAVAVLFFAFGATAVGWNGLFLAEIARRSPHGQVSTVTSGAMFWNFSGILVGPALFATVYRGIGSYAWTYGLLAAVALAGYLLLRRARAAARREEGGCGT